MKNFNINYKLIKIINQQGVGMVEVMVALLVFSVGMLGIASLQMVSLKTSFEAEQRYEATVLVDDIMSRITASDVPMQDRSTVYDMAPYDSASTPVLGGSGKDCNLIGSDCSQAEIAAWDIFQWQMAIKAQAVQHDGESQGLKGAKACLEFHGGSPRVTIVWESMSEMGNGPGDIGCGGTLDGKYRHYSGPRRP
ncbi:MAG: type IV pilus modification protein PilV [Gammaproteobacteria bacterium]|nr:MAG: type IV pilus modification protein PilV [Gammaproteobacteria bacterium]